MEEIQFNSGASLIQDIWNNFKKFTENSYPNLPGQILLPNDPTYITRQADEQLFKFLQNSQDHSAFCCLFAPPKVGKTSLVFRMKKHFSSLKYKWGGIAFKNFSKNLSERSFYLEIITIIYSKLDDKDHQLLNLLNQIWQNTQENSFELKFINSLQEILKITDKTIIIFLDNLENVMDEEFYEYLKNFLKLLSENHQSFLPYIKFILAGCVNHLNFFQDDCQSLLTQASIIEISPFHRSQCGPLKKVLKNHPSSLAETIIDWTQGQPFLTQILCKIIHDQNIILEDSEILPQIENLFRCYCLKPERLPSLNSHFQQIHDYFVSLGNSHNDSNSVLPTLNLYHRILRNPNKIKFDCESMLQWDLLMSGLILQSKTFLFPANPIYQEVFNQQWILEIKHQLNGLRRSSMPSVKIYNRKVYMLIDQSGSMAERDPKLANERRWIALRELIKGHIFRILEQEGMDQEKICDEITVAFFSPNFARVVTQIQDDSQVAGLFKENQPDGNTFIVPTLRIIIDDWFLTRDPDQGGFIIIYTDGELNDKNDFEKLVHETCKRLNSQDELKMIIIGYGSDIIDRPTFYENLDENARSNQDRNGEPCDIIVFEKFDTMPNIIEIFDKELSS